MRLCTLATCSLNQWSMDFESNLRRIVESIAQARALGATYRVGPELEIPGYGCEDHFLEGDTEEHSWEAVAALLAGGHTSGLVVDVGLPATHRGARYNCRAFLLDGRVLLLRPKVALANDGNYREARHFAAWRRRFEVDEFRLPPCVAALRGQEACPIGDAALAFADATLAAESCEELFTPAAPHAALALAGVEVFSNGSGSHHELRKLRRRLDLIRGAGARAGGVYLYANQQGCDGGRLYYDGSACVAANGRLVALGPQFSASEVNVVAATVDLDEVAAFRGGWAAFREQAAAAPAVPLVRVDFRLCGGGAAGAGAPPPRRQPSPEVEPRLCAPEEEIARGPALWLWDLLRRSGAAGFLLPLSGGADSAAVAAIVGSMCQLVVAAAAGGDARVAADAARLGGYAPGDGEEPSALGWGSAITAADLAGRLLTTLYMGTENSSAETRRRAADVAAQVGARHLDVRVDALVAAAVQLFAAVAGRVPRFRARGGSPPENLALQNIQARLRMVVAFLFAQLSPWAAGRGPGFLLVLGSANVDEALRGYLTKYDCSAADANPIGGISKGDLKSFLEWGARHLGYPALAAVAAAAPTAELEPLAPDGAVAQTDEADMGVTYAELGVFGRLRQVARLGPVGVYRRLEAAWGAAAADGGRGLAPAEVAAKVKHFFRCYALNRHKATVLPPAYHAEAYAPDDNRHDHRQFLYNAAWPWQFAAVDAAAAAAAAARARGGGEGEAEGARGGGDAAAA